VNPIVSQNRVVSELDSQAVSPSDVARRAPRSLTAVGHLLGASISLHRRLSGLPPFSRSSSSALHGIFL
jgi:hypothetical protein